MNSRELKTAIRLMRDAERRIRPDAAWVLRTRTTLLKSIRHQAIKQPVMSFGTRCRAFIAAYVSRSTIDLIRGPVMAVISVFAVVAGGSLASVSAAERSIPGDLLYPVKLATEQARILMESEAPGQLKLKTEFAERRGQEIKQLVQATPSPKQTQQIKNAADMLKKDLDAVKMQLHTVASESSPSQAATSAKDVDERSGRLASVIKDVKDVVSPEIKQSVIDVQVAAVSASVKAVQIMIDTHDDPGAAQVVSAADIKRVVTERVQGLEAGISDAEKKVADASSSTTLLLLLPLATTTIMTTTTTSTVSRELIKDSVDQLEAAKVTLQETKQLLQDDNFSGIKNKLGEAAQAITNAEKNVTPVAPTVSPPSEKIDPSTSTAPVIASSTSQVTSLATSSTSADVQAKSDPTSPTVLR